MCVCRYLAYVEWIKLKDCLWNFQLIVYYGVSKIVLDLETCMEIFAVTGRSCENMTLFSPAQTVQPSELRNQCTVELGNKELFGHPKIVP